MHCSTNLLGLLHAALFCSAFDLGRICVVSISYAHLVSFKWPLFLLAFSSSLSFYTHSHNLFFELADGLTLRALVHFLIHIFVSFL